jgi:DNA-binding MarR family transcriptional regulator
MKRAKSRRPTRDILELETFLPYRLSVLAQRLSRDIEERQRTQHKLAGKDWKLMQILAVHGELLPADIHRMGTQNKAQISRALKCLLDRGLVAKRPRAGDGRTFGVSLTEAGWAVYQEIVPRMRDRQEKVLADLSRAETKELRRLIDRLDEALDRSRPAKGRGRQNTRGCA